MRSCIPIIITTPVPLPSTIIPTWRVVPTLYSPISRIHSEESWKDVCYQSAQRHWKQGCDFSLEPTSIKACALTLASKGSSDGWKTFALETRQMEITERWSENKDLGRHVTPVCSRTSREEPGHPVQPGPQQQGLATIVESPVHLPPKLDWWAAVVLAAALHPTYSYVMTGH